MGESGRQRAAGAGCSGEPIGDDQVLLALVKDAPEALVVLDLEAQRFVFVNAAAERLYGLPAAELLKVGPVEMSPPFQPDGRPSAAAAGEQIERALGGGEPSFEWTHRSARGEEVPCRVTLLRLPVEGRALVRGQVIDLRETRRADEVRRQILESAFDAFVALDAEGKVREWNRAAEEVFGYARAEAVGRAAVDLIIPPDLRERHRAGLRRSLERPANEPHWTRAEFPALRRDGSTFHAELTVGRVPGVDPPVFTAFIRDVTDRTRQRRRLETIARGTSAVTGEPFFRSLCQHLAAALGADFAFVGRLVSERPRRIRTLGAVGGGKAVEELEYDLEGTPCDRVIGDGICVFERGIQALFPRDRLLADMGIESYVGVPLHDQAGRALGILVVLFKRPLADAEGVRSTLQIFAARAGAELERVRTEAALLQAQKVESIGRLAGGVAHDFNNLLTAIVGFGELGLRALPEDSPARRHVQQVVDAGIRGAALTRQLLAFARRQVIQPAIVDVGDLVGELSAMLRRLIGDDIELAVTLAPELWPVRADPSQVQQVLVNLAVNARDAMPRGGKLSIEVDRCTIDEVRARLEPEAAPGEFARISVTDTGTGMTPEVRERVFEPFFTTKAAGRGTGLGLATCHGIVRQHGGHISVYSEPGRGTTFRVHLPRARESAEAAAPGAAATSLAAPTPRPAPPAGAPRTILFVEDDASIRGLIGECLAGFGYSVLEATDGEDALRKAGAREGAIDLLVTDVVMPRLGGPELARRLVEKRPGLRTLYTSGYTEDAIVRLGVVDGTIDFIEKPYTPDQLARKIAELLAR
jgi:PAS domain S-box-containing protein